MIEAEGLTEELFSHSAKVEYCPNMHNCPHSPAEDELCLTSIFNFGGTNHIPGMAKLELSNFVHR